MPASWRFVALIAIGLFARTAATATAAETVAVSGRIVDAGSGGPVSGAAVEVADDEYLRYTVRTNADGRFTAIGLASGTVRIGVKVEGRAPAFAVCDIPSGQRGRIDLQLSAVTNVARSGADGCTLEPPTSDVYIVR